jgi:hypothetical protein
MLPSEIDLLPYNEQSLFLRNSCMLYQGWIFVWALIESWMIQNRSDHGVERAGHFCYGHRSRNRRRFRACVLPTLGAAAPAERPVGPGEAGYRSRNSPWIGVGDIGYRFLVDAAGQLYEGRGPARTATPGTVRTDTW